MLSNVSIVCFAASYSVALVLEVSRLFFRLRVRWVVMIVFGAAGLLAHTAYLWHRVASTLESGNITPLASWYDWCLVVAWVLAAAYLALAIRRPENTVGVFLIPLILGLIATAYAVANSPPFGRDEALNVWGLCHGLMLLLGTVVAALGAAAGLMYLLQAYRLKHKMLPRPGLRLPSLEWLQKVNRRALKLSTCLLALGLLAGLVLNVIRHSSREESISWTDPVVLSSAVLFLWLAVATLVESLYKPAREGHKVAYITLVSSIFLGLVLGLVLWGQHGITASPETSSARITDHAWAAAAPLHGRAGGV